MCGAPVRVITTHIYLTLIQKHQLICGTLIVDKRLCLKVTGVKKFMCISANTYKPNKLIDIEQIICYN